VGDLAPEKTFVHVLDDYSLDILMSARDTISDFVSYLTKREILLRGQCRILATGEEQLLACYLVNLDGNKEHNFVFPAPVGTVFNGILLTEGHWEDFQNSPQRIEQLKQDEVSYAWDELIEKFSYYALRGEQDFVTAGGFKDAERIFRFMAREPRVKRRYFAKSLLEMIYTTPINVQNLRVIPPLRASDPYYVFLLLPAIYAKTYDEYRDIRRRLLEDCCLVTKLVYPDAKDIIGIATETDPQLVNRSEDSLYIDAREWDAQMESETKKIQMELGILTRPKKHHELIREFPDPGIPSANMKNPRNKPCPCGSGKKFKHCCLNK